MRRKVRLLLKKIQSTSSNLHLNCHSMFQRENKNCIDLEVIVLLLAESDNSYQLLVMILYVKIFKSKMKILIGR
jgi:hypothetical protein